MEKVRKYESRKIEVCRNCGGEGMVNPKLEGNWLMRHIQAADGPVACEVCGGTGRVRKHTEITVTVRSFDSPLPPSKGGRG